MERDDLEDQNWREPQPEESETGHHAPGPSQPEDYEFKDWALI